MDFGKIIQQQIPPQVVAGGPINDVQLIALIAANKPEWSPSESVAWATEVVLEAILQAGMGKLQAALQQRVREQSALEE